MSKANRGGGRQMDFRRGAPASSASREVLRPRLLDKRLCLWILHVSAGLCPHSSAGSCASWAPGPSWAQVLWSPSGRLLVDVYPAPAPGSLTCLCAGIKTIRCHRFVIGRFIQRGGSEFLCEPITPSFLNIYTQPSLCPEGTGLPSPLNSPQVQGLIRGPARPSSPPGRSGHP